MRVSLQHSADADTPGSLFRDLRIQTLGLAPSILDVILEEDLNQADGGGHLDQEVKDFEENTR